MISLPPTEEQQSNIRHLYADAVWFGVLAGSTLNFLAVYMARLEASSMEIGLITAGPAVVNLFFSLPSGNWLAGKPLVSYTYLSSVLQRLGFLALVPLAWLFGTRGQVWGVVLVTLAMSVPGTFLAIAFNSLFAAAVPDECRAQVVGRRNALLAVGMTASALLSGQILSGLDFPVGYQIVFVIGALGALLSSYHLGRLHLLESQVPALPPEAAGHHRLLRLDLLRTSFGSFLAAYLVFYIFQNLPLPLFPLYYVNNLNLSDNAISLGSALFYGAMMLTSLRLVNLSRRLGHHGVLLLGALLFGQYPLLLVLGQRAVWYWAASLTGGIVWAIVNGGLINRLMERVPAHDRPASMALHNVVLNMGTLLGALSGPWLAGKFGLLETIYLSAALRLLAGLLLVKWG